MKVWLCSYFNNKASPQKEAMLLRILHLTSRRPKNHLSRLTVVSLLWGHVGVIFGSFKVFFRSVWVLFGGNFWVLFLLLDTSYEILLIFHTIHECSSSNPMFCCLL